MKRSVMAALLVLGLAATFTALADDSAVVVNNHSDWDIHELYFSPVGEEEWGEDQLGDHIIGSGESFTLVGIPCDYWDIMIIDEDGDECILEEVDLCGDAARWDITNDELLVCVAVTDSDDE